MPKQTHHSTDPGASGVPSVAPTGIDLDAESGFDVDLDLATMWEAIADAQPDQVALVFGDEVVTWGEFEQRSARLAGAFATMGAGPGTVIAQVLTNSRAYMESTFAAFKLRATPVGVGYDDHAAQIASVIDTVRAKFVVFQGAHGDRVADAVPSMNSVRHLVQVDDGTRHVEDATWYHTLVAAQPAPRVHRSGSDLVGLSVSTQGGAAGVDGTSSVHAAIWRHDQVIHALVRPALASRGIAMPSTVASIARIATDLRGEEESPVSMSAAPLLHGAALCSAVTALALGGVAVLLPGRSDDADRTLELIQKQRVTDLMVDGDADTARLNDALDTAEHDGVIADLSSLRRVVTVGSPLSTENQDRLERRAGSVSFTSVSDTFDGAPLSLPDGTAEG